MRLLRPRYLGVGCLLILTGLSPALLASNAVPATQAAYHELKVTGARAESVSYTIAAGVLTGVVADMRGNLLLNTASAHFDTGGTRTCVVGLYNIFTGTSPVTCTGFTQQAAPSWTLTIDVV